MVGNFDGTTWSNPPNCTCLPNSQSICKSFRKCSKNWKFNFPHFFIIMNQYLCYWESGTVWNSSQSSGSWELQVINFLSSGSRLRTPQPIQQVPVAFIKTFYADCKLEMSKVPWQKKQIKWKSVSIKWNDGHIHNNMTLLLSSQYSSFI